MRKIKLNFNEFFDLLDKCKKSDFEFKMTSKECNFNIWAENVNDGDIFIALDSSKYSNSDGGLGFTNNEDSVYGLGGHIKVEEKIDIAIKNGAKIIVVDENKYYKKNYSNVFILVQDCLDLIVRIARCCLEKSKSKTIAVTGSTGKTTVTSAIYDFLSVKFTVRKICAIRNSVLGISTQIIQNLCDEDEFLILEMQMDAVGQIERFCKVVKPDYAVITSINLSHYSRFKNIETIFNEKLQVYKSLKKDGKLIINGDDEILYNRLGTLDDKRIHMVGLRNPNTEILIDNVYKYDKYNFNGFSLKISNCHYENFELNIVGRGELYAAAFALFFAKEFNYTGIDIREGLLNITNPIGRFQGFEGINQSLVIMDSYNANYCSMIGGLDYLNGLSFKKKIAILGSMMELGDKTEIEHKKVGRYIEEHCNITHLITFGEAAIYIAKEVKKLSTQNVFTTFDYEEVLQIINNIAIDDLTVLYFKGSGSMRMELLVPYFLAKRIF